MKKHVVFLCLSAVTMGDEGTTEEGQFIKLEDRQVRYTHVY